MTTVVNVDVVELDYNDLVAGVDLTAQIEKAYGEDGAGLLTVKNVPSYVEARSRLLPLSKKKNTSKLMLTMLLVGLMEKKSCKKNQITPRALIMPTHNTTNL